VNQRSPVPLTRMANSRPFRVRHVTTLPARIVAAASSVAFALAIASVRKKLMFPARNSETDSRSLCGSPACVSFGPISR